MKITSLSVENAYGHLSFDLTLPEGLTFLIGINGSGKTTAIRLIEALLTPSLEQLDRIPHDAARLGLEIEGQNISIGSSVRNGQTTIEVPHLGEKLIYQVPEMDTGIRVEGTKDAIAAYYASLYAQPSPVLIFLRRTIDTPLFLSLERRNIAAHFWQSGGRGDVLGEKNAARHREFFADSVRRRMPAISGMLGASLVDVQVMIQEIFRRRRAEQERSLTELREEILLDSFKYQPAAAFFRAVERGEPASNILNRRSEVESALKGAGLTEEKFKPVVDRFFEHISQVYTPVKSGNRKSKSPQPDQNILLELALNKPVIDRVLRLIGSSDRYKRELERMSNPITQLIELVNGFFADSNKRLAIDEVGWLYVTTGDSERQSLDILSSGERQLLVIFGHLAINREINKAGIFVIDEPELSLHLKWQEIFVDSILAASPGSQFILATHAPSIVMDRVDCCVSFDRAMQQGAVDA